MSLYSATKSISIVKKKYSFAKVGKKKKKIQLCQGG